jgi:hypothetical protein
MTCERQTVSSQRTRVRFHQRQLGERPGEIPPTRPPFPSQAIFELTKGMNATSTSRWCHMDIVYQDVGSVVHVDDVDRWRPMDITNARQVWKMYQQQSDGSVRPIGALCRFVLAPSLDAQLSGAPVIDIVISREALPELTRGMRQLTRVVP